MAIFLVALGFDAFAGDLPAGTYYARVFSNGTVENNYSIKLETSM